MNLSAAAPKTGVYIHIPYCIQRCTYCDFATYEQSKIMPPQDYFALLRREIQTYAPLIAPRQLDTIYFGGGTPSLVPAELIVSVIEELSKNGLSPRPNAEITLEINPATLNEEKMRTYLGGGVNRFSVGAQTFDDKLLKSVNREHDAKATRDTLDFLASHNCNFTFDILFALPQQTLAGLARDLEITRSYQPKHISAYCLTVPDGHPLAKVRLPEERQLEMFDIIKSDLSSMGLERYEISNFAIPGFESRHNLLYWTDEEYLSFGLSAHSYLKVGDWGARFWNPSNIKDYQSWLQSPSFSKPENIMSFRKSEHFEYLLKHQALTDYLHTSLRMMRGLNLDNLAEKFGPEIRKKVESIGLDLTKEGLLIATRHGWTLSERGILLSNLVFSRLTFLDSDLRP